MSKLVKFIIIISCVLASLGGLFGLCTGGSIISVIELIYFVADILTAIVCSKIKKSNIKKLPTTPIYTIKDFKLKTPASKNRVAKINASYKIHPKFPFFD